MKRNKFVVLSVLVVLLLVGIQPVVKAPIEYNLAVNSDISIDTLREEKLLQNSYRIKIQQEEQKEKEEIKYFNIPLNHDIQDIIFEYCSRYDVGIPLVLAVIEQETGGTFNTKLVYKNKNGTKDFGLMQLNSSNHKWFAEMIKEPNFDPLNVRHNLHAGIKFLSILKDQFIGKYSDDELRIWVCNSYNMGLYGFKRYVDRTGTISRGYSKNVLEYRQKYEEDGNNDE